MDDLIKRLEDAPEGSRELEFAMAKDFGWTHMAPWSLSKEYWIAPDDTEHDAPPQWTRSFDAAFDLVSAGCSWKLASSGQAWVWGTAGEEWGVEKRGAPILALCIAAMRVIALKARAEEG